MGIISKIANSSAFTARNSFGFAAFTLAGVIIGFTLSPWVPDSKEQIALIVLGNVLAWPTIILQFHFGSSQGSKNKDDQMAKFVNPKQVLELSGLEKD